MPQKSPFPAAPVNREPLHLKLLSVIGEAEPNKPALVSGENQSSVLTYSALSRQTRSVHAFLKARRFPRGGVVALVLHNCIEWPILCIGTWAAAGAISGASALFTDYELERQFADSACSVVVSDESHLEKVLRAAAKCARIQTIVCIREQSSRRALPANVVDWEDVLRQPPSSAFEQVDPESIAILPYSSGTTGSPKGVMLTHRAFGTMMNVLKNHYEVVVGPHLKRPIRLSEEKYMLNLPFYHIYGFGVLNMALLSGATGIVMRAFEPALYCSIIQEYKVRLLMLVPPILIFLTKNQLASKYDLTSLEFILVGAAPSGRDICEEFLQKHPSVQILAQGYGMTECGMASHLADAEFKDPYAFIGRPASNFEQKVIDVTTGKELPRGERGELCIRSPTLMQGYLNRPEATAETIDNEGWLHTGDVAYVDDLGRAYIVDRMKELIKVKGLQVAPAEMDDLLLSHPSIRDAAVIGIPDKNRGELVRAYVVRGSDSLTEKHVADFVASKVSVYKHLTGGVHFIDEIPKSAAGKILRRELRDRVAKEAKAKL